MASSKSLPKGHCNYAADAVPDEGRGPAAGQAQDRVQVAGNLVEAEVPVVGRVGQLEARKVPGDGLNTSASNPTLANS